MPSTRLRSRSQLSELRAKPVVHESQPETQTLDTLSTAVLPTPYTVHLAAVHSATDADKAFQYHRGQEYLNDGVRRIKDKEGDLGDLRAKKRRRIGRGESSETKDLNKGVYWYTASLRYPCSCTSFSLKREA